MFWNLFGGLSNCESTFKDLKVLGAGGLEKILKFGNAPYTSSVGTRPSEPTESFTGLTAIRSTYSLFVSGDSFLIMLYARLTGVWWRSTRGIEFGDSIWTDLVCICNISEFDWNTRDINCFPASCAMISGGPGMHWSNACEALSIQIQSIGLSINELPDSAWLRQPHEWQPFH